jgi:two-component system, OmpR family, sensor kinase
MSSSRPTERPARWQSPAGWPLRTRLVAIMITLLAVLGLAVGGTAELFLRSNLYQRLDTQVTEVSQRLTGGGRQRGGDGFGNIRFWLTAPPPDVQSGSIVLFVDPTTGASIGGGLVQYQDPSDQTHTDPERPPSNAYIDLSPGELTTLTETTAGGEPRDVSLGDSRPDYRVITATGRDGTIVIIGLSLEPTQAILLKVALYTGGAVLVALVIAGWAGAFIVRRTLLPLARVSATATRVSELELDRGEVRLAQRVPEQDTDPRTEVGQVGAALNRMLDHVGNALESRHASEMQVRQFVADASHELRTPLAAIRGYAELSRRSRQPIPAELAHVLGRVESEAKRMTVLVEDLLLLARLDAGRPLAHDPVDLTMLIVDAVSDAHATGPGHIWQLDLPEEPVTVIGDGARLHQVLANLLANARTHTPEGSTVTVGVSATAEAAELRVIDDGPGIQAQLQSHIFERFARGDSSRSRAAGSTGLGLSIVHAVVTAHGGRVSVQSQPGRTVFTVLLPMTVPARVPARTE